MGDEAWKKFYEENLPPAGFAELISEISEFCSYHLAKRSTVVLVTSGGTTVPLEHNTVRFVDNFSAGTRGAASTEYFLRAGYAVIFMHRTKSLEPFLRHMPTSELMESFEPYKNDDGNYCLKVEGKLCEKLVPLLNSYKEFLKKNMLLKIQFTSLSSYLHLLHEVAYAMRPMKKNAILYLAAAVSDFYIPPQEMLGMDAAHLAAGSGCICLHTSHLQATHKICSDEALNVNFKLVPKILQPLVRYWVPEAFVVSFKLETDQSLLIKKSKGALQKYGHKLVIGNELSNYKYRVIFVTIDKEREIILSQEDMKNGKEIEEIIVNELSNYYKNFKCS